MKVRIMVVHPISNPRGPEYWDGKVHTDAPANLKDVWLVGAWLTKKTGFRFSYKPGHSRLEGERAIFFPARRQSGVHCMWLETVG